MELKPLKKGEVAVTLHYNIPNEVVGKKIPFIRYEHFVPVDEGISAVYVDDGGRKKPTRTITFNEAGEHIVRIVLADNTVIPTCMLYDVTHSCATQYDAMHIESVEIPDTVLKIGEHAFDQALNGMDSFQLPDTIEAIGYEAFSGIRNLIVGRSFKAGLDSCYEHVTIPENNDFIYVENGYIIEKESKALVFINKNTDVEALEIPEGVTKIPAGIKKYCKSKITIPGSVENVKLVGMDDLVIKEGCKAVELYDIQNLSLPASVMSYSVNRMKMDTLTIPENAHIVSLRGCNIKRLDIMNGVKVESGPLPAFEDFEGEIFIHGHVEFKEWGCVSDQCIIHVNDEETALKLRNSKNFNAKAQIIFEGATLENTVAGPDKAELLGLKDSGIQVNLDEDKELLNLVFSCPKKISYIINAEGMSAAKLDGIECPRFKGNVTIPKGVHLLQIKFGWGEWKGKIEVTTKKEGDVQCEAILLRGSFYGKYLSVKGIRHAVIDKETTLSTLGGVYAEKISIEAGNLTLSSECDCIVDKQAKKLLYVQPNATHIPEDITEIDETALRNYALGTINIPATVEKFKIQELNLDDVTFEVQGQNTVVYLRKITANRLVFINTFKLERVLNCTISQLEFKSDVVLVEGKFSSEVFSGFSGKTTFEGKIENKNLLGTI